MRRVLVVANRTLEGPALREVVRQRGARGEILVVAPALNSRLRHWFSDEDPARRGAEVRLGHCLDQLRSLGVRARGRIGDADPMRAIEDALVSFDAMEIVIATLPRQRSHWLEHDLVGRALRRFRRPIVHVVVDPPCGLDASAENYAGRPGRFADATGGARI